MAEPTGELAQGPRRAGDQHVRTAAERVGQPLFTERSQILCGDHVSMLPK